MSFHPELGRRTLIMGILNVTPDSFSDGGKFHTLERALAHARRMIEEGADFIDVGGESTRPGHVPVSAEEELRRVIPVIRALMEDGCPVPVSIDTYKAEVAAAALDAGASIVNDIWGGKKDPDILRAAAERGAKVVLMHNREDMDYGADFVRDIVRDLEECAERALAAGVKPEHIALDPGFGFAKTMPQHRELMGRLSEIAAIGYPVLLGTSRKRFIRYTLEAEADDVVEGTIATTVLGIAQGVSIVRVHDVRENVKAARMADAIVRRGDGKGGVRPAEAGGGY